MVIGQTDDRDHREPQNMEIQQQKDAYPVSGMNRFKSEWFCPQNAGLQVLEGSNSKNDGDKTADDGDFHSPGCSRA